MINLSEERKTCKLLNRLRYIDCYLVFKHIINNYFFNYYPSLAFTFSDIRGVLLHRNFLDCVLETKEILDVEQCALFEACPIGILRVHLMY